MVYVIYQMNRHKQTYWVVPLILDVDDQLSMYTTVCWCLSFWIDEEQLKLKARREENSRKLSILPTEPPPEETQCLKPQAEGATAKLPVPEWESQEQHLLEMFPKCSLSEARSALSIAKGDMEEAVRLILEGDVQLSPTPHNVNHGKSDSPQADQKLKESILEKYMLVDREDDKKTHRPLAPKDPPKKLVRYHGNQVVTTKGERYQLVKKDEAEDMKKTYVSLKPSRKYRFHWWRAHKCKSNSWQYWLHFFKCKFIWPTVFFKCFSE